MTASGGGGEKRNMNEEWWVCHSSRTYQKKLPKEWRSVKTQELQEKREVLSSHLLG